MSDFALEWSATLHRLWRSVAAISVRDELASLVLPPLSTLPGVRAVWGLRHGPDDSVTEYRWAGLPLTDDALRDFACRAARAGGALPAHGITDVLVRRLDVPGEAAGTFLVCVDDSADIPVITACLQQVVEVTEEAVQRLGARRSDYQQQTWDALLAEASVQMDAVLDTEQTVHRVPRMTVPAVAEGCLVYLFDHRKPVLRSAVHVDMRRLSGLLGDPLAADRLAGLAGAAVAGTTRVEAGEARALGTRSIELQVLRARGRVIGALVFLFDRGDDRIPSRAFLRDIAYRAALAIDNSTLYESRRREVATMQQHLLPTRLPGVDGLAIAASYTVGDEVLEVGGDFYDVVVRADGGVAATIGDVCGRGVDAAALTGMARHTLAALLQEGTPAKRAMSRLNARLRLDGSWRFITAGVALVRPAAAGFTVDWTSAGHPAPVVMPRGEAPRLARGGGVPLGVLPRAKLGRSRLRLAPGDTLVMFTDGLTESRDADGRMFEEQAFWETLDRLRGTTPETLVHELSRASATFGAQADDIAVLAIQAREPGDDG